MYFSSKWTFSVWISNSSVGRSPVWSDVAKGRADRTRKNELKIYLSDNEKYILDRKVELSKRKSVSDYIRTLILFGFVYDVDYSYLRQYNETLGKSVGI